MKRSIFLLLVLALTVSCFASKKKSVSKDKAKAGHVVLIGIDGWGAYSVPKAHNIPNIRYFMENGCYTLKDRTVLPSASAINWSSMFMGVPTEMHGYTTWGSRTPEIPSAYTNNHNICPTIFSVIREQMPTAETGCLFEWDGIKYLVDTLSISYVAQAANWEKDSRQLVGMATEYIKTKKPEFIAVCNDQLDHTGHTEGHDTPAYYKTLDDIDKQIGLIMQAVKDAGIWDNTVFILTADHGGINKGHGGQTLQEMQIPFIICGKNIKKGMVITDAMMQYDCAATIAEIFGLKRPQSWRGQPAYSVFFK